MNTFPKSKRLVQKAEFTKVFNAKKRAHSTFFLSYIIDAESPKIGIIVAKKHHKLAVQRNTIKRIVREYFRQQYELFPNAEVIIIAKQFSSYRTKPLWQDLQLLTTKINETYQSLSHSSN